MNIPLLIRIHSNRSIHVVRMERLYKFYDITRHGFHSARKRLLDEIRMMDSISIQIRKYRLTKDRRAGSRFLYYNLRVHII